MDGRRRVQSQGNNMSITIPGRQQLQPHDTTQAHVISPADHFPVGNSQACDQESTCTAWQWHAGTPQQPSIIQPMHNEQFLELTRAVDDVIEVQTRKVFKGDDSIISSEAAAGGGQKKPAAFVALHCHFQLWHRNIFITRPTHKSTMQRPILLEHSKVF
jgi:hypothetical protein